MCSKTKLLQQHFVSTAIKRNKHYRIVKMLEPADLDTSSSLRIYTITSHQDFYGM